MNITLPTLPLDSTLTVHATAIYHTSSSGEKIGADPSIQYHETAERALSFVKGYNERVEGKHASIAEIDGYRIISARRLIGMKWHKAGDPLPDYFA